MTRDEAMRQIAALHTEWSLRYGDVVPYDRDDSAPHPGSRSDYAAHQADRSASPDIDDPLNNQIKAILEQIDSAPTLGSVTTGPLSQCGTCQRLRSPFSPEATGQDGPWCEAFPTGIPEPVYDNTLDHREPVDGDHGLRWLARPGATYPDTTIPEGPPMTAATEPTTTEHTGVMIALVPTAADATRLQGTLLAEEGALPLDELHLTLAFLGEADLIDPATIDELRGLVEQTAATLKPVEAEVFGMAILNPDGDEPCVVLLVGHNDALPDLHMDLINQLHAAQVDTSMSHRPWLPHITLAYTDDLLLVGDVVDRAGPVMFDRLRLAVGAEVLDFPLGTAEAPASEPLMGDEGP